VTVRDTAEGGLAAACELEPEAIVCDIDLPDCDGYWVARKVRLLPSRVSVTPFLFLSGLDDQESRLQGFHVGADVYMTKPFRINEVVAQIGALVQMASRLRQRRDNLLAIPEPAEQTAIEGDLSHMSVATVLTVIELERRSGIFEVISKKRKALLEIADGCVVHGTVGGTQVTPLAALRSMLTWKVGRFSFHPSPREAPPERRSIAAYLLEATRLEDESARAALDLPPSRRRPEPRFATTALGGPPPTPEDVAPPSSRGLRAKTPPPEAARVTISDQPAYDVTIELESAPPSAPLELPRKPPLEPPSLRSLARSVIGPEAANAVPPRPRRPPPPPPQPSRPAPQQPPRPDTSTKKR
jgi:CheY-like chemotaxis protein